MDNVISLVGSLDSQNKIWFKLFVKKELLARRFNLIIQEEEKHEIPIEENKNVINEEQKEINNTEVQEAEQENPERGRLARYGNRVKGITVKFKNLPSMLIYSFHHVFKTITYYFKVDKELGKEKRIRYPRYFGYTKELETYSAIKAFAVEAMKKINYELPYSENIIAIISLDNTEVILTENRLLCITKENKSDEFDYWYLLYSDILSWNTSIIEIDKNELDNQTEKLNNEEGKIASIKDQIKSIKTEVLDMQTPENEFKHTKPHIESEVQYILTIMHFNDYANYKVIKKDDVQIKNFGLVDFKFHKKTIIGNYAELDIINEIHSEVTEKIKRTQGERVL